MSSPVLRCTGHLELELDSGVHLAVDLAGLTLEFVETWEPSLIVVHCYRAPVPGAPGVTLAFDLVEWVAGYKFADVAARGPARIVGHRDLAARVDDGLHRDLEVELRVNRAG